MSLKTGEQLEGMDIAPGDFDERRAWFDRLGRCASGACAGQRMSFGVSSMTAPLRRVAVRRPGDALLNADPAIWHYGPAFDPSKVIDQHADFAARLKAAGCDVLCMTEDDNGIADSVFTYDASLVTPQGAILMSPGKALRQGEADLHRTFYDAHDIPVLGAITGEERAEAGDTLWLTDNLLAIRRGFRTNSEGISQIAKMLNRIGNSHEAFDLPYYTGSDACLCLMSLVSLVDTRKALVCLELVPAALHALIVRLGYQIIPAPFDEFESSGTIVRQETHRIYEPLLFVAAIYVFLTLCLVLAFRFLENRRAIPTT